MSKPKSIRVVCASCLSIWIRKAGDPAKCFYCGSDAVRVHGDNEKTYKPLDLR